MAAGFLPRDVLLAFFRARVQGPLVSCANRALGYIATPLEYIDHLHIAVTCIHRSHVYSGHLHEKVNLSVHF